MLLNANRPISAFPTHVRWPKESASTEKQGSTPSADEFLNKYNEVLTDYEVQANQIEPYLVPLAYSQIEIVSRSVLWR